MCQFPDLKDILNEIYNNEADVEYSELERFLPETTQQLFTVVDKDDVIRITRIQALSSDFSRNLLGDLYSALVDNVLWPHGRVEIVAAMIKVDGRRRRTVPGVTIYFKSTDGADFLGTNAINLVFSNSWKESWLAVSHDQFPTPNDVSANKPMRLYDADELKGIVHHLIPKEHRAWVVAELATTYGWKSSVHAGNQVCLIG